MSLGQRIAKLRQEHSQTLQDVADGAGLTPSFLSRLERDQVNISVGNLRKLAQFFGVPMTHFFEGEDEGPAAVVVRANERLRLSPARASVHVYGLTPPGADLTAWLIEAQPGATQPMNGEQLIFLSAGQLHCQIGAESYQLDAGDTLLVRRSSSARWESVGSDPVVALMVSAAHELI